VYEIMTLSDGLKAHIQVDTDLGALKRQAYREGMHSLRLSAARKLAAGQTTLEEVLRVTPRSEMK
jgi:general secretion pathway protein E